MHRWDATGRGRIGGNRPCDQGVAGSISQAIRYASVRDLPDPAHAITSEAPPQTNEHVRSSVIVAAWPSGRWDATVAKEKRTELELDSTVKIPAVQGI